MLLTSVEDLKELHKKEELEFKFKIKSPHSFALNDLQIKFQLDHLPFANLILNIASKMKNAPQKPEFNLRLDNKYKKRYLI